MCGIVGSIGKKINRNHLNSLSNRGPDQRGLVTSNDLTFGHTRLSILDIDSLESKQPACREENILVFNGEIYNFVEIKEDLNLETSENPGDTEVLLACLEKIGVEKTVERLVGMFAFAYYEKSKDFVWIVRDRLGQKPLFYYSFNNEFSFASDISLLKEINNDEKFTINNDILDFYFSAFYIPSPYTIYNEILSLKQGTILKYDVKKREIVKNIKYWEPKKENRIVNNVCDFLTLFDKAVNIRLRSDVPIGAFLSGGIDSTYVVKRIKETDNINIETFTASVKDDLDETVYAKKVAEFYKLKNTTIDVDKNELSISKIRQLVRCFGQPFADSSILPTELVCNLISNYVTVAISGDGSDEIFMGYNKYHSSKSFEDKMFRNNNTSFLNVPTLDKMKIVKKIIPNFSNLSDIEKINQFDIRIFLEGDILQKVDRLSMLNSLEVRSPFLDHRLVELSLKMNLDLLIKDKKGKYFLKKLLEKDFEEKFVNRPKIGFMLQMEKWRKKVLDLIRPMLYICDKIDIIDKDIELESIETYTLFSLLVFLVWYEEYML